MSLFTQLRRLYARDKFRLEDFHTEIVAQVLRDSHGLVMEWLASLEWQQQIDISAFHDPDYITVATQEEFGALAGHPTDSRPDVALRISKNERLLFVLIESKVGSKEGPGQLKRYADHPAQRPENHVTALIYITREFEPAKQITPLPLRVAFTQTRWFQFYDCLKQYVDADAIARELALFMEENNMSQRNQFTAIDVLALTNFPAARSMMDATMWGDVSEAAGKILGKVRGPKQALNQIYLHERYILYRGFGPKWDFQVSLGYWFDSVAPGNVPWVGVMIHVNPKSGTQPDVIKAMRSFLEFKKGTWDAENLSKEKEWGSIFRGKPLNEFFSAPDHVEAIKTYFLKLVAEVAEFQARTKTLPWTTGATESDDE